MSTRRPPYSTRVIEGDAPWSKRTAARLALGLTQRQCAEAIGITRDAVKRFENPKAAYLFLDISRPACLLYDGFLELISIDSVLLVYRRRALENRGAS